MKQTIIDEATKRGFTVPQIAYILATVKHETNNTFKPVVECYWMKDPDKWLRLHKTYYPYYGRGLVQITWKDNYRKFSNLLNVDLVNHPSLALDPAISVDILLTGFRDGLFTGKKLSDYIGGGSIDFTGARRCINGTDKARLIAGYASDYLKELQCK